MFSGSQSAQYWVSKNYSSDCGLLLCSDRWVLLGAQQYNAIDISYLDRYPAPPLDQHAHTQGCTTSQTKTCDQQRLTVKHNLYSNVNEAYTSNHPPTHPLRRRRFNIVRFQAFCLLFTQPFLCCTASTDPRWAVVSEALNDRSIFNVAQQKGGNVPDVKGCANFLWNFCHKVWYEVHFQTSLKTPSDETPPSLNLYSLMLFLIVQFHASFLPLPLLTRSFWLGRSRNRFIQHALNNLPNSRRVFCK